LGQLSQTETDQLDQLMKIYRQGLVRKERALKVAVEKKGVTTTSRLIAMARAYIPVEVERRVREG
jgi:hypothetical protein